MIMEGIIITITILYIGLVVQMQLKHLKKIKK